MVLHHPAFVCLMSLFDTVWYCIISDNALSYICFLLVANFASVYPYMLMNHASSPVKKTISGQIIKGLGFGV